MIKLNSSEISKKDYFLISLFCILPITLFVGTGLSNLVVILIDCFLINELLKNKNFKFFKNNFFYILIFLWLFLLLNSIFIAQTADSFIRSFGVLRFILFAFSIKYFFYNKPTSFKKTILNFWFFLFLITTIDLLYELFTGADLLGFKSNYNGRLAGFTGDELRIGAYYIGFILITLSHPIFDNKKVGILFFSLIFLITALVIGERSNFIKLFFILSIFLIIINRDQSFKRFFLFFVTLVLVVTVTSFFSKDNTTLRLTEKEVEILNSNEDKIQRSALDLPRNIWRYAALKNLMLKARFFDELFIPIRDHGILHYIKNSRHGKHYDIAIQIFKQNPIFGIGIKNFRHKSALGRYNVYKKKEGHSTHPHQIHFELLSETGLVGYLFFLFFFSYSILYGFNSYLKKNNTLALCGTLFLIATIIPIIPMGSFFSSYGASIFWINFGLLISDQN